MDKIVEECLRSLIKRVEALENRSITNDTNNINNTNVLLATQGQIKYLKQLGPGSYEGMTKKEASVLIDELVKNKKLKNSEQKVPTQYIETKKLTEEEIKKLEEENALF